MNADTTFIAFLESTVNRLLRLDSASRARVAELKSKVIRLQTIGDHPFTIIVLPDESGLQLRDRPEREPDVTLTGDIPVIFRFALRRFFPDIVTSGEVQISGDIDLGQRFQRLLEEADFDWEEQVARVLGDVPAHQLGNVWRDLGGWSRQTLNTLKQDFAEYLQEESRLLPVRARAETFRQSVEILQCDLENLEKRLARLRGTAR
ncbi:MAG: SCP2 sterol-binding domain-containing protein [Gammaproteobacteria bacterium]|nr:SCP2 sterol-binding domain-containing protein [Gammaproteobacteria bacterium]MDH3371269.1 SCP2 sterol-binding domain-containing protein [Gammaproteobacteria bacterium]MDH3407166.1 SCP2 sterol-binding domain-containing protein [Gammaproteobacteria bacterium]MDH3562237.1 SCP2 sterol-binding domain-containing protein [Gammaproteobacteria bacterium]MDH5486461.1 SCP2 sterol-binding domain-containing protein [Gammaproteobacteria bacterium]